MFAITMTMESTPPRIDEEGGPSPPPPSPVRNRRSEAAARRHQSIAEARRVMGDAFNRRHIRNLNRTFSVCKHQHRGFLTSRDMRPLMVSSSSGNAEGGDDDDMGCQPVPASVDNGPLCPFLNAAPKSTKDYSHVPNLQAFFDSQQTLETVPLNSFGNKSERSVSNPKTLADKENQLGASEYAEGGVADDTDCQLEPPPVSAEDQLIQRFEKM